MKQRPLIVTKNELTPVPIVAGARNLLAAPRRSHWKHVEVQLLDCPEYENPELISSAFVVGMQLGQTPWDAECYANGRWNQQVFRQHDLSLRAPGEIERWRTREPHQVAVVYIQPALLLDHAAAFDREIPFGVPTVGLRDAFIASCVSALVQDAQKGYETPALYGDSIATALALHMLANYGTKRLSVGQSRRGLSKSTLQTVCEYIEANLHCQITLDELAALAHLSRYHFTRLFKISMSVSPFQYVVRRRVKRARSLMKKGEFTLKEVARMTGFYDASHLSRVLRQCNSDE